MVAQFLTAGIMLGIAFLVLGYALLLAQVGLVLLEYGDRPSGNCNICCTDRRRDCCRDSFTVVWRLRKARTRTTKARARLLVRPGALYVLDPVAGQAEIAEIVAMKEDDAMEPMLKNVRAVFAAERATGNTFTNDNRLQPQAIAGVNEQLRLQQALERATNARADAMLDQVLGGPTWDLVDQDLELHLTWWIYSVRVYPSTTIDARACALMVACLPSIRPEPFSLCRHQLKRNHAAPSQDHLNP